MNKKKTIKLKKAHPCKKNKLVGRRTPKEGNETRPKKKEGKARRGWGLSRKN